MNNSTFFLTNAYDYRQHMTSPFFRYSILIKIREETSTFNDRSTGSCICLRLDLSMSHVKYNRYCFVLLPSLPSPFPHPAPLHVTSYTYRYRMRWRHESAVTACKVTRNKRRLRHIHVKMLTVFFSKKLKQTHWFVWPRIGLSVKFLWTFIMSYFKLFVPCIFSTFGMKTNWCHYFITPILLDLYMFRAYRPIFRRVRTAVHTTIGSVSVPLCSRALCVVACLGDYSLL